MNKRARMVPYLFVLNGQSETQETFGVLVDAGTTSGGHFLGHGGWRRKKG